MIYVQALNILLNYVLRILKRVSEECVNVFLHAGVVR